MVVAGDALIKPAHRLADEARDPLVDRLALQHAGRGRGTQGLGEDRDLLTTQPDLCGGQGDPAVRGMNDDVGVAVEGGGRVVGRLPGVAERADGPPLGAAAGDDDEIARRDRGGRGNRDACPLLAALEIDQGVSAIAGEHLGDLEEARRQPECLPLCLPQWTARCGHLTAVRRLGPNGCRRSRGDGRGGIPWSHGGRVLKWLRKAKLRAAKPSRDSVTPDGSSCRRLSRRRRPVR